MCSVVPTTWVLYGLAASQVGDDETPFISANGDETTVSQFLEDFFGYEFNFIWPCIAIVVAYTIFFRAISAIGVRYVSFQSR